MFQLGGSTGAIVARHSTYSDANSLLKASELGNDEVIALERFLGVTRFDCPGQLQGQMLVPGDENKGSEMFWILTVFITWRSGRIRKVSPIMLHRPLELTFKAKLLSKFAALLCV